MKKMIIILLLLVFAANGAMAQNDAMYVYRNDGQINAFLKTDVDSIRYSQLDIDSILHHEYVIQEVWTIDSVYRIPLAVIDSVGFITPKTVYKDGVVNLSDNLIDYIIGADNLTLKLNPNIPTDLIPRAEDKLVLLDGCAALPNGFAGQVLSLNSSSESINVVCAQTYIEDIFESFCSVQTICGYADNSAQTRAVYDPSDHTYRLGPYTVTADGTFSQKIISDGELALKGEASLSVSVAPTFRIHTFIILGEGQGLYFNSSITGNLEVSSNMAVYGGLEWEHEFLNPELNFPIPFTANLVNFYINPGLFLRADAVLGSTLSSTQNYAFVMSYDYSSIGERVVNPYLGGHFVSSKEEITGSVDGSAAIGAYFETGFNLISRELSKICVRGEYGLQVNGNFVLRTTDTEDAENETTLYEKLKASSIEYGPFASASLSASDLYSSASVSWQLSWPYDKWDLVPTFENTKLTCRAKSKTSLDAYTKMTGNCRSPVPVGYVLFDADKKKVADFNATAKYTNKESEFEHTFNIDKQGARYVVSPKVTLFGHDILASPSAELVSDLPKITDFKQTGMQYSPGAFNNDGRSYDYKFDVEATIEIESLEGVAEWGYVYKDPYENVTHIPLTKYGTSYTDTRYAYFRNESKSSVCLYGYVKYEGDDEYYYDEPHVYPLGELYHACPDDNHPHAIDLGLPSGTKWCCMNVGASSPEQYGGYFAWGETYEKAVYTEATYAYITGEDIDGDGWYDKDHSFDYVDKYLRTNIAGTQYDVAYAWMGAPWRMPSHEQLIELVNNCTFTWGQKNKEEGVFVTGKNGMQIFVPAAGERWSNNIYPTGAKLWSSSPSTQLLRYGSNFLEFSPLWSWPNTNTIFPLIQPQIDDIYYIYGFSVRAVCP